MVPFCNNPNRVDITERPNIIEEKDFDSKILLSKINDLINDDSKLSSMSIASKKLGNKDATKIIVDLIAKGNYIV